MKYGEVGELSILICVTQCVLLSSVERYSHTSLPSLSPSSWPGYTLSQGSTGDKVRQIQEQLNVVAGAYPAIPKVIADGVYGPATANAVEVFQSVFGLPETGTVDYRTWYKISEIYVGVSRIAELS